MKKQKSRKITPWEGGDNLTATQTFLKKNYEENYIERHRPVAASGESEMINSYTPVKCRFCNSEKFKKNGLTKSGIQRYMCVCSKTFIPTTGTIFDEHRISLSEWIEYCLNLFRHVSIVSSSWNNKNAFTTSRYWLQKLFLTLENVQNTVILSDCVWLDEMFYSVRSEDIIRKDDGTKPRGLSKNQICIAVATDKQHSLFFVEGTGQPTQKKTLELFRNHIKPGSILIHDEEDAHTKLIKELSLDSRTYSSKDLKGLADKDNPLNPVNRSHAMLKHFLNAHGSFDRDNLQGYLNLFAFVTNPPLKCLKKLNW
jgi:transposase-like protein